MPGSRYRVTNRLATLSHLLVARWSGASWLRHAEPRSHAGSRPLPEDRLKLRVDPLQDRLGVAVREPLELLVEVAEHRGDVGDGRDAARVARAVEESRELRVRLLPRLLVRHDRRHDTE